MDRKIRMTNASYKMKAYEYIKCQILSGAIAPGAGLDEKQFCKTLGMSRTPVHEAFAMLSSEGLVDILPSRGMVVSRLSLVDIEQNYTLRSLVEPYIIRQAAACPDKERLQAFKELFSADVSSSYDKDGLDNDLAFHLYLASATGNAYLTELEARLMAKCQLVRVLSSRCRKERADSARDEHIALIDAISSGDGEGAVGLLLAHLSASLEGYRTILLPTEKEK